ncbi:hypothetical protein [Vibrio agarivorans]|uniref:Uncharacterized protein n=1 Tax=Vibrio agarivorans TaxID=153622 RepID=A0ABT7Y7G7_9VIBR|nr:hypothetical protein [Vibrio agarivorans]MDN2484001.1 hypothetical protein [Vibrio agarivorans]
MKLNMKLKTIYSIIGITLVAYGFFVYYIDGLSTLTFVGGGVLLVIALSALGGFCLTHYQTKKRQQ